MSRRSARWQYLDLYRVNLHVATTQQQLRGLFRSFRDLEEMFDTDHPPQGATTGYHGDTDGVSSYHVVWWVDAASHANAAALVDTIAHEAMHGAAIIFRHIGADVDAETINDEPLAYLVGFLTRWLWECSIADLPN